MSATAIADEIQETASSETKPNAPTKPRISRTLLLGGSLAVCLVGAAVYWLHARHFETTDDARALPGLSLMSIRWSRTIAM